MDAILNFFGKKPNNTSVSSNIIPKALNSNNTRKNVNATQMGGRRRKHRKGSRKAHRKAHRKSKKATRRSRRR